MKTVAIVLAGGESEKEGNSVPRQFVHVYDKPVLVYTLEGFQRHPQIDEIGVVCLSGWEEMVWAYSKQFNVNKLKWVVSGGENGQESIYNGIKHLINSNSSVEIVIIHDGIRPLIDESNSSSVKLPFLISSSCWRMASVAFCSFSFSMPLCTIIRPFARLNAAEQ